MKHGREPDAPWVAAWVIVAQKDRVAAVDSQGDLGVASTAEDRACAGIGVQEQYLFWAEREAATGAA
jgi:hypothetical protein